MKDKIRSLAAKRKKSHRLLKKGKRGMVQAVFGRSGLYLLLMLLQVGFVVGAILWLTDKFPFYLALQELLGFLMILQILNSRSDWTAKATWLIIISVVPIFGIPAYWYTRLEFGHRALLHTVERLLESSRNLLPRTPGVPKELAARDAGAAGLAHYLKREGCWLTYERTQVKYFPLGEDMWQELLIQLEKAEKFIFMEYFIVDEGEMWESILDVLCRKAKEGVEVRMMYDGTCEFTILPHDYPRRIREMGIQCKMFSPVVPLASTTYNYRDHRKITVIDGHIAFTGGVNLADEYINRRERFGHWKDTAVMLRGEAAQGFTMMFLQMWNIGVRNPEFEKYIQIPESVESNGFVIPYGDCPLDGERVGERVYMDILNRATRYVHIMTPYLILDGELETALKFAAERGVDVRLILPGIPDKKIPYALAKRHYASLKASGVKIYEYTPGFVHAKVFVSDDHEAVVGSINLDYRSLYHHFECATWMYGTDCIPDIEADFQNTMQKCAEVTEETMRKEKRSVKLMGFVMKLFAPLL